MTPLLALLCLGLSVGTRTPVQAGTLPRPTLWAEPRSLVPWGRPMTLWCRGTLGAKKFYLYKTGSSSPWEMQLPLEPGDKAKFSVSYMTESDAGTYHCSYLSPTGWPVYSKPLELVVTGLDSKPSLSVSPSPVVASGETVTLQCGSQRGYDTFVLTQEGDPETDWKLDSQRLPSGQHQALFRIDPGPLRHRWSIRCYGLFSHTPQLWSDSSDPRQLLVLGASRRPSLLSLQSLIVTPGQTLTLQCHSKDAYDTFALYKEKSQNILQHSDHQPQAGISLADFPLGPVSASHGGQYHCFGRHNSTSLWSEPSNPIDILVAEQLSYTPSLSMDPGPPVTPGNNVTLLCRSSGWINTFLLAKEGATDLPLCIKVDKTEAITQAQFSFHPVTSAHNGTYRCYSSNSKSPYRLSHPSVPLHLWVSGPSGDSKMKSAADVDRNNTDPLLIGLSMAGALLGIFLILFLLLLLLCLRHCHRQAGQHKSGATHSAPQDTGLNTRSRPKAHVQKDSPGDSYNTFTHTRSEEGERLNPQIKQDEDPHGATYAQAEAPEAPLEVTYAQLKYLDTAQETTATPPSLSGEPPEEPSVYAALAFH
ncbi:leukocyte immunoglobulin-like receptor subfamily A member 6 [Suncus etruscus]|uniref:leukocyte immunoglobulin-like receptor subfamily A member 6 n=1 Tax=Suncus etruscus TaxID=109475 RepID=UPI00211062B9|nr:leukocyte immunoglobulin-like receptor subfamily A member 6 [Suncus etruscus]